MKKYKKIEISTFDFKALFDGHEDVCSSCHIMPWSVLDIDIKSKQVRGLLCQKCKDILIWAKDDSSILRRAHEYFTSHACCEDHKL